MTAKRTRIAAHALLFLLAIVVFYAGLAVGLQHNADLGSVLWVASAAIAGLNLLWIFRARS